jgi:Ca2+/Na+ antiporter
MGMIILGAGTSFPEAIASVIATVQGNTETGIKDAIKSNIFDILLCLGIPWVARTLIVPILTGNSIVNLNRFFSVLIIINTFAFQNRYISIQLE